MAISLQDVAEGVKKDLHDYSTEALENEMESAVHPQIFEVNDGGTGAYHQQTSLGELGTLDETTPGTAPNNDNLAEGYTVVAKTRLYTKQVPINPDANLDVQKIGSLVETLGPMWGRAAVRTLEEVCAKVFNYGGYTAGQSFFNNTIPSIVTDSGGDLIYDGKPMFALSANNHPAKAHSTTYYNAVALSLTQANIETVHKLLVDTNAKDERGNKILIMPDILLVPHALEFTARKVLQNPSEQDTANRNISGVTNIVTPVTWRYLSDASAWFYGKRRMGLKLQFVERFRTRVWVDQETEVIHAAANMRFQLVIYNWRGWVGSNVPTS